jgi:fatty acid desaturase
MTANDNPLSAAGLVADTSNQNVHSLRQRPPATKRIWQAPGAADPTEEKLRRRARRQGLALMIASGLISIIVLYGVWWLLHGVL